MTGRIRRIGINCHDCGLFVSSSWMGDTAAIGLKPALESSAREAMVEDVSRIVQAAPWIERCPARMWAKEPGLFSELADAVDRLAAKVGAVKEALGEDR